MGSPAARQKWLKHRTHIATMFCDDFGMVLNPMNQGYQLRVENLVDFYPVNGRYCILQTGERGDWNTSNDMRAVMLRALPVEKQRQSLKDNWVGPTTLTLPVPEYDTAYLRGVRTMDESEYNRWYRRVWRWLRFK